MKIRRDSSPREPERDMALTGTILQSVAAGSSPPTLRVFRPGPTVAFGRRDTFRDGFEIATTAARLSGFSPVVRHAGGQAVAYDDNSIVVEWIRPEDHLVGRIEDQFEELTTVIRDSLEHLGVSVDLGELPNEYCPGRFSLHLPAGPKVVGVAQRVVRGASLTSAVVAVGSGDLLRAVTARVYRELALPLDLSTIGAVADRFAGIEASVVADTITQHAASRFGLPPEARPTA
jgi:octanoyl-[GcvH]:protein N-octanoyltransferase